MENRMTTLETRFDTILPTLATKEDLKILQEYFQDHDFFKDILSKKSKEERFAMLECLQYVEKKAGETIFKNFIQNT